MKLIRYGEMGRETPGVLLDDGRMLDTSSLFRDYDEAFFAMNGIEALEQWIEEGCEGGVQIPKHARLGPPIDRPSKIVCVGQNYSEHAKEMGGDIPKEPVLFMKATSAWSGPYDDVIRPRGSEKLDYESELAVIIGSTMSDVPIHNAMEYIAGYSVLCDYSERAFQKEMGGQWMKGKSADRFCPMGPHLVPAANIPDPQALRIWCKVNGETRQNGYTGDMIFSVAHILSYISRFMTLLPGDVVSTGTPSGVGMGYQPPRYLQPSDLVECGIEGIGEMSQRIVAYPA